MSKKFELVADSFIEVLGVKLFRSMSQSDALEAIEALLSGQEWDSDTLEAIAQVMIAAGYEIKDSDE